MCLLIKLFSIVITFFILFITISAHLNLSPDESVEYHQNLKRDGEVLARCLQSLEMREQHTRMLIHHEQTLHRLRKTRGIDVETGKFSLFFEVLLHS